MPQHTLYKAIMKGASAMHEHTRAPQDKVCAYEYTVRRGDSFYLIANRLASRCGTCWRPTATSIQPG